MTLTVIEILLRTILLDQTDDLTRSAYADALEEAGEGERAGWVRGWIAIQRLRCKPSFAHDMNTCRKCVSIDALWDSVPPGWLVLRGAGKHMPGGREFDFDGGVSLRVDRGFVESVRCPLAAWLEHGVALCARHPVTEVKLTDRRPEYYRIGNDSGWGWLRDDREPPATDFPAVPGSILYPFLPKKKGRVGYGVYDTEADAMTALSLACVNWAREANQLPPLKGGIDWE